MHDGGDVAGELEGGCRVFEEASIGSETHK
jgi:hypothetical protein